MVNPVNEDLKNKVLIRMEAFTQFIFQEVLGKRYKAAGLRDFVV